MSDEPNTEEELIKEIDRLFKKVNNDLKMIDKRDNLDYVDVFLIKEPFALSPPLKEHLEIEEIENPVN